MTLESRPQAQRVKLQALLAPVMLAALLLGLISIASSSDNFASNVTPDLGWELLDSDRAEPLGLSEDLPDFLLAASVLSPFHGEHTAIAAPVFSSSDTHRLCSNIRAPPFLA
jgi:hypothetical protein